MNTQQEAAEREALLPCPFCGSDDVANVSAGHAGPSNQWHAGDAIFAVNCRQCGASVPNAYRNSVVVKAWNRRATLSQQGGGAVAEPVLYVSGGDMARMLSSTWAIAEISRLQRKRSDVPFYATPAAPPAPQEAREPLTDEQIFEIADSGDCVSDKSGWGPKFDLLKFARAVIAATAKGERG